MENRAIVIITYEYPPVVGGAGIYANELFNGLREKNIRVDLINLHAGKTSFVFKIYSILKSFLLVLYSFKNDKYDTVVINDGRAKRLFAVLSFLISKNNLKKGVVVMHGGEILNLFQKPSKITSILNIPVKLQKLLPKLKAVIVVSQYEYESFIKFLPTLGANLKIIPHGISPLFFYPKPEIEISYFKKKLKIDNADFVIFSLSRLEEKKGQDTLIQAVAIIKDKIPNLKVIIGGDGSYKIHLEQLSLKLRIDKNIIFVGSLSRNILVDYFNVADIFVLPSRFLESFGLVYIESMACGTPVISSNLGGVGDIVIDNENGFLINPRDYISLSEKILQLYDDKSLLDRFQSKAIESFNQKFSVVKMVDKFLYETN